MEYRFLRLREFCVNRHYTDCLLRLVCILVPSIALGQLPFREDFEVEGPLSIENSGAWVTSETGSFVQNTQAAFEGSHGLSLTGVSEGIATLSRDFTDGNSIVWTDFYIKPVLGLPDELPGIGPSEVLGIFFDHEGYPLVFDANQWQKVLGGPTVTGQSHVRVTIQKDYSARLWSLWIDGAVVATDIAFNTRSNSEGLSKLSVTVFGDNEAYLDTVTIDDDTPLGLNGATYSPGTYSFFAEASGVSGVRTTGLLNDFDGDGLTNFEEYAFNLNIAQADTGVSATSGSVVSQDNTQWMALDYRRNLAAEDIEYLVEGSPDLVSWEIIDHNASDLINEVIDSDADGDGMTALMRKRVRVDAGNAYFMRMRLNQKLSDINFRDGFFSVDDLVLNGGAQQSDQRLRILNANSSFQTTSSYSSERMNAASFVSEFDIQVSNHGGRGCWFRFYYPKRFAKCSR